MRSIIQRIATGPELSKDISREEARQGMEAVLREQLDPVQSAIFLIALRMKRESDQETQGVLDAIRDATLRRQAPVDELLDIFDPYDGFNRSLLVSPFLPALLAACGIPTICHGVAAMGPKFGATHALVLKAAGVKIDLDLEALAARLGEPEVGWGYIDQSVFCPSLHALTGLRTLMVKRPVITTVEGLARPMVGTKKTHLMTGYVHQAYPRIYAMLARHVSYSSALLVRGVEGGVIPSLKQTAKIWSHQGDEPETPMDVHPHDLGIVQASRAVPLPEGLSGYRRKKDQFGATIDAMAMAEAAADTGLAALAGEPGPARDSLVYGAALCLWHLKLVGSLASGAERARTAIDSGKAAAHFGR